MTTFNTGMILGSNTVQYGSRFCVDTGRKLLEQYLHFFPSQEILPSGVDRAELCTMRDVFYLVFIISCFQRKSFFRNGPTFSALTLQ